MLHLSEHPNRGRAAAMRWMPSGTHFNLVRPQFVVIPASLVVFAVAAVVFRASLVVMLPLAVLLPLVPFMATWAGQRAWRALERDTTAMVLRRDPNAALRRIRAARVARFLGPRHLYLARYALVMGQFGEWRRSSLLLDDAWIVAPPASRVELVSPLARAKYEAAQWDDLRALCEDWRRVMPSAPAPRVYGAAAALFGDPTDVAAAAELMRGSAAPSSDIVTVYRRVDEDLRRRGIGANWTPPPAEATPSLPSTEAAEGAAESVAASNSPAASGDQNARPSPASPS